jgi:hypothetical protein
MVDDTLNGFRTFTVLQSGFGSQRRLRGRELIDQRGCHFDGMQTQFPHPPARNLPNSI